MTRSLLIVLCLAMAGNLLIAAPIVAGEHPQNRTGFFIGLGLGVGNAGADLAVGDSDRQNSVSGNFRFGWAVANNVALGLESSSWTKNYDLNTGQDLNFLASVTTFAVTYWPGNMGLYLRGGLGFSSARAELKSGTTSLDQTEYGVGLLGSLGYEWRLTQKFALGPQIQWAYLGIDDESLKSADFMSMTAQATWYW